MSGKHALEPEFASLPSLTIPSNRLLLRLIDGLIRLQRRSFRWSDEVRVRRHPIRGAGDRTIDLVAIEPSNLDAEAAPALLDYHGGGFFLSHAARHLAYAERYALAAGCRVFFPQYRLSIDHPFPAALDDAYESFLWVHENAKSLGVDRERIALLGDSAGGALAAGVAQRVLDHGGEPICAQILICPVTDHETKTDSALAFSDTPMWRTASNRNMWKVYLRGAVGEASRGGSGLPEIPPPYAAPLHRERFEGLPPARVEVAEFDPLRDEGLAYARALEAAGVPVECREVPGAVHGYDLVEGSPTADAVLEERLAALRRFFGSA